MNRRLGNALVAGAVAATAVMFAATSADAQTRKRTAYESPRYRSVPVQRARSRITVTKRSYLDAGTEVYPGSKNYTDYVFPPGYRPYDNFDPTGASRHPLPNAFELRSYHAPGGIGY